MKYKLSIITINRNNAAGLRKTIESVVSQTYTDFEYIIIDGASTDESIEVIKEYADRITYWVSEPDKGIYNAMNKGILKASGVYLLFLNSGDWLVNNKVIENFCKKHFNYDIVAGNSFIIKDKITVRNFIAPEKISYDFFVLDSLMHQSTFQKRELLLSNGMYNEEYLIVSDWEFYLKILIVHNCTFFHYDEYISYYDFEGISHNEEFKQLQNKERQKVFDTILPRVHTMYQELDFLRKEYQKFILLQQELENWKNGKLKWLIVLLIKMKNLRRRFK